MTITAPDDRPCFDTRGHLKNAERQARERHYDEILIVDVDAHHYENEDWSEITEYMTADPVIKHMSEANLAKGTLGDLLISQPANQDVSGRIRRYSGRAEERVESSVPRTAELTRRSMDSIGIDYTVLFPTPMLQLSLHPRVDVEVAVARAYARWITERILPVDDGIKTMLYLPFNDPEASIALIEEFAEKPGVVGFMVASVRYRPVHDNAYVPVYRALEERGMPIGFHSAWNWFDRSFTQLTNFLSVHALGRPFYNMIHATNWVINGIPERFPELNSIWIECGLAWLPFLTERLDLEYLLRSSEAPVLRRKPSDYFRENMYYTQQPMEMGDMALLEHTFRMMNAETQLLYASDYPHWDFDLPSVIYDLPFLNERAKRRILGENASQLFKLADTSAGEVPSTGPRADSAKLESSL